jgi:hypothetical protein
MKSLFTFLLLFFVAYYFIKAIYRLIKIFFGADNKDGKRWSKRNEGDVTIDYQETQKKHIDKNKGEYIDYEEIK